MEKLLTRLARQLDAIDEASLMALWGKYATLTSRFEPTRRWEEAALVFSLIQAKRWKNQLFNYNWASQRRPAASKDGWPDTGFSLENEGREEPEQAAPQPCRVLQFRRGPDSGTE